MKIFFLFFILRKYYRKFNSSFFDFFLGIIFSFFFLIEFIFIFLLKSYFFLIFILYKFLIKEQLNFLKRARVIYVINNNNDLHKKKYIKKNGYINNIKKTYYNRRIHYGLIIVYIQIFLRKIKDRKNYMVYLYNYKIKKNYNILKKKIINNSLYFFLENYNLIISLENFKKKLWLIIFFLNFLGIYNIVKLKNIIFLILNILKKKYNKFIKII